jgi:exodeoxyribonuclease III
MGAETVRIASWNVNSIAMRLQHVVDWLTANPIDILCLQEIKTVDEKFPSDVFANLGYTCAVSGQKTYNGVAILSRHALSDVDIGFVEDTEGAQRRFITATACGLRVINVYVPNGQDPTSPKYTYKLDWLKRLRQWLDAHTSPSDGIVLCGDFNIAPDDRDVYDPSAWRDQILCTQAERDALQTVAGFGLHDSFRLHHPEGGHYSWWDYRMMSYRRKLGLRIDHLWITSSLATRCTASWIDEAPRRLDKPSDHAPVGIDLSH